MLLRIVCTIVCLLLGVCLVLGMAPGRLRADPLPIVAKPVPLDIVEPERTRVGRFEYRGGLNLTSSDKAFGGLSTLRVVDRGARIISISDQGYRVQLWPIYDSQGVLVGIRRAEMDEMVNPRGKLIGDTRMGDAESMVLLDEGELVGFEYRARLWLYPRNGSPPVPFPGPDDLSRLPVNEGLETMTKLADGRLLLLSEGLIEDRGNVGWIGGRSGWQHVWWRTGRGYAPTDATTLPGGDVLVLERRILPPSARVRLVDGSSIKPGAQLDGETIAQLSGSLTFDNMEGIDAIRGPSGETLVYLISDDNKAFLQRTLLLMYRLLPL